jgi:hypothetical protein
MPSISRALRLAVTSQLSDASSGFNPNFTAALSTYSLDASTVNWSGITWTSPSTNFLYGRVSPANIDESSGLEYPILTMDSSRSAHTNEVVSMTFAGPVQLLIDFHLSYVSDELLFDFASYADAAEDAMFATINNLSKQNYGAGILYNGRMACQRTPIVPGGNGWIQSLTFAPEFKVFAS